MPAKVSTKGQLVLPAKIRKKYGIAPGKDVEILDFGDEIVIVPSPTSRGRGEFRLKGDLLELISKYRRKGL